MVKVSDVYAGGFVTAAQLPENRHVVAVITSVVAEAVGRDQSVKLVVDLRGTDGQPWPQRLVLNKQNGVLLATAYGDDTDRWTGKTIELWSEPTTFQGNPVMGVKLAAAGGNGSGSQLVMPVARPASPGRGGRPSERGADLDDEIPF
jgi:hypothetical protein